MNKINNQPLIFKKKVKDTYNTLPLNIPNNTLGPNRHFPVATKEWFNSIYSYDSNMLKNLNTKDKELSRLIQSYFNLYFSRKILKQERIRIRFRRLNFVKIFVGKAELKHTNNKVIINLNVFNQQKSSLIRNMKNLFKLILSPSYKKRSFYYKNSSVKIWRKLELYNSIFNSSLLKFIKTLFSNVNNEIKLEKESLSVVKKKKVEKMLLEIKMLESYLDNIEYILSEIETNKELEKDYNELYVRFMRKTLLEDEIEAISKHKLLLDLNRSKFEYNFINKLKEIIKKIYKKEIELNIVNLNNIYLDISILTEAIAKKLKNRNNTALRTITMGVNMVKIPSINKYRLKYGIPHTNQSWLNKVQSLNINSLINNYKKNKDSLNQILLNIIPNPTELYSKVIKNKRFKSLSKESLNILDIVYKSIKYRKIRGIRLEAKGRLTRRYVAAKAVFKLKWKGGLKNVDSSYRGYSSTILRGHLRSNVQYHTSVYRNRIGAYGVKGWISGR